MMVMSKIKNKVARDIITFIMLTIGTIIAAAALECFLIPNTILDGGVTGISIIIFKLFCYNSSYKTTTSTVYIIISI